MHPAIVKQDPSLALALDMLPSLAKYRATLVPEAKQARAAKLYAKHIAECDVLSAEVKAQVEAQVLPALPSPPGCHE